MLWTILCSPKFQFLCNSLEFAFVCFIWFDDVLNPYPERITELLSEEMSRRISHIFAWLFGKNTTPKELLKKNQRILNRAVRDMDSERVKMERQEKKIIADIKKMAKENQIVSRVSTFSMHYILFPVYF